MSTTRPGRSHTRAVVLILGLAAVMVTSASALALWVAHRSQATRVERHERMERPTPPGNRGRTGGPSRGRQDGSDRGRTGGSDGGRTGGSDSGRTGGSDSGRTGGSNRGQGPKAADCGAVQPWDTDGDGISDRVEQNNRTFHAFDPARCDRDPSAATGQPASGALLHGVNLADDGDGYVHLRGTDPPDSDDWATLRMLNCLEAVGREARALDVRITVNDLSRRPGGPFVPHSSHQNGLDVDVRYLRSDGRVAPLDIRQSPRDYDALTTQAVMRVFIQRCDVSTVFVDLPSLNFTNDELDRPVLVQAPGHTNHFHVRLRRPS